MDERREHQRQLLAVEARFADMDQANWSKVRLFDVSKSGMSFIAASAPLLDKLYSIEFGLPHSEDRIACVVIALHAHPVEGNHGYRIGARFVWIDEHDAERVADYVRTVAEASVRKKLTELGRLG